MESLSLIDVSAEDDFFLDLASPPPLPDPSPRPRAAAGSSMEGADSDQPAAGYPAAAAKGRVMDPRGATEQVPEPTESPKKRKAKGGFNLRKSLAWDSAFFTSEGVLDTEELGIVNSTFRKAQGSRLLPGIAEELRRSGESTTSTLESESFALESVETELFDNVRASIQRTLGKPDKASGVTAASKKIPKATAKAPPAAARKGADRIPQSKIRPPVSTSNSGVGTKQRPQITPKEPTAARVVLPGAAEAKPSSRPPRALPRVATMRAPANTAAISENSEKRSSTGGVANRQAPGKSANASASMQSRPAAGTKASSTSKSVAFSSATVPPSQSNPIGTMTGAKTKSPTQISKNRTAQRIPVRSSAKSDVSKVNPARLSKNRIPTRSHGELVSPIISPSSSVDSMSSVISGASTASTIGKTSYTSESFSTRSSSLSPSIRKSNDCPPTTKLRPPTVTEVQSSGTSCDSPKCNKDTTTQGNGFKPSGLRRPTPKIGYFDAEKSIDRTGGVRVQVQPKTVQFSPSVTPNPRISSTQRTNPTSLTFDQHEPKSMGAAPSQTKALPPLPLGVAQTEVEPSKVMEHEVEPSKVMEHEASQAKALPSLPLGVAQTEVEPSKVMEHEASQTKASPSRPLGVAYTEASKMTELEAYQTNVSPSMLLRAAQTEVKPSKEYEASQTEASPALPLRTAQTEVEPSKVAEHEASMHGTSQVVTVDIGKEIIPALHHNIQANGDANPSTVELSLSSFDQQESEPMVAPHEEIGPSHNKSSPSLPLGVAQMEVEPSEVIEHEACMPQTCPVVTAFDTAKENIPALHQNIQLSGDLSPLKENILVSHQNIQAKGDMTPVTLLTQNMSSISLGAANTTPLTLLNKKRSSVSVVEASPFTLLTQKLSSISLEDATDQLS